MSTGMDAGSIAIGQVETVYTSAGRPSGYRQEIRHNGLHEYRLLRAPDKYILENKRATLVASWKDKWNRVTRRAAAAQSQAQSKDRADAITAEAQSAIEQARGLLSHALKANTAIPWAKLADVGRFHFDPGERFPVVKFDEHGKPLHVAHVQEPPEPLKQNFERVPTLLSRLLPPIRRRIAEQDFKRFEEAHDNWWSKAKQIRSLNQKADGKLREANSEYQEALHAFELRSQETKARVADLRARYETKDPAAVTTIADLVLAESQSPSRKFMRDCKAVAT